MIIISYWLFAANIRLYSIVHKSVIDNLEKTIANIVLHQVFGSIHDVMDTTITWPPADEIIITFGVMIDRGRIININVSVIFLM